METVERILAVQHNWWVVAVLEAHHQVQFYPWHLLQSHTDLERPISRLVLPTAAGPHSLLSPGPSFSLTDQALVCGEKGSNRLHKLSVWRPRLGSTFH